MNNKQLTTLQTVTKPNWIASKIDKHIDGNLAFDIKEIGGKVLLFASNGESIRWFEKHTMISMVIGTRGGINKIEVH